MRVAFSIGFLMTLVLFHPASALAVEDCGISPSPSTAGPEYAYPLDRPGCSDYDPNSANFQDFINHAHVQCLTKEQLKAAISGTDADGNSSQSDAAEIIDILNAKHVSADTDNKLTVKDNANFALGNEQINTQLPDNTKLGDTYYGKRSVVSMYDYYNPSHFTSHCLAMGITDFDKCAATIKDATLPDGTQNTLITSNPYQRLTNMADQLIDACKRADHTVTCSKKDAANSTLCGNVYNIDRTNTTRSLSVAEEMQAGFCKDIDDLNENDIYNRYYRLAEDKQLSYLALEPVKAAQKYFVVIRPICKPGASIFACKLYEWALHIPDPLVIEAFIPQAPAVAEYVKDDTRRWNSPDDSGALIDKAEAPTGDVKGNTRDAKLINKIGGNLTTDCDNTIKFNEFMGAHSNSYPDRSIGIHISFDIVKKVINTLGEPLLLFKAWLVSPKETNVLAVLSKEGERKYWSPDYSTILNPDNTNTSVNVPQKILDKPISGSAPWAIETIQVQVPCPSGSTQTVCYEEKTARTGQVTFSDNSSDISTGLPGGENAYFNRQERTNKMFQSLNDENHWQNTGCYWTGISQRNPELAKALVPDPNVIGNTGSCGPAMYATTGSNMDYTDICAVASKYQVPCEYLKAIWMIESGQATDCSGGRSDGPMQVGAGAQQAVDPNHTLDKCTTSGAWELAARILLWKKYGSSFDPNNPTDSSHSISYSLDPNSVDLQTTGQYNGSNNCDPNLATECRWGAGKSYCDGVISLSQSNMMPGTCDPDKCYEMSCSYNLSTYCQGQTINCNQ